MALIHVRLRNGEERSIDAVAGISIMENLRHAGVDELLALCGGCCSCATCHVIVDALHFGQLEPLGPDEDDLLDSSSYRSATSRLSCQVLFSEQLDDIRIEVVPEE